MEQSECWLDLRALSGKSLGQSWIGHYSTVSPTSLPWHVASHPLSPAQVPSPLLVEDSLAQATTSTPNPLLLTRKEEGFWVPRGTYLFTREMRRVKSSL